MIDGPLSAYRALLDGGVLKPDPAQHLAAEKLQSLHTALAGYRPAQGEAGWLERFGLKTRPQGLAWTPGDAVGTHPRHGLYIFGEVGRGKTMLMDIFFETATIAGKRRVHFHEFMRDIHAEIHRWRQIPSRADTDPIPRLARTIAAEAWLLCLDELQITDIADAMIVGRLFQHLMDDGVVVVTTSNRPPEDLYKDGLQRERFLPFIELIMDRLDLLQLDARADYRLGRKQGLKVYHTPLGPEAVRALDRAFARLTEGRVAAPETLGVQGRALSVPVAAAGVARFTFADLCGRPLGPSDYIEIAARYHTLVLSGIPVLSPENSDEARRFVTLVDALYEHKVTLICSAAAPPEALYPDGLNAFEFQRTQSRLIEMQAADYVHRA